MAPDVDVLVVGAGACGLAAAITAHDAGVDVAIEAVGKPQTWEWAVNMVRRGGVVNFFGGCPNDSRVLGQRALGRQLHRRRRGHDHRGDERAIRTLQ